MQNFCTYLSVAIELTIVTTQGSVLIAILATVKGVLLASTKTNLVLSYNFANFYKELKAALGKTELPRLQTILIIQ